MSTEMDFIRRIDPNNFQSIDNRDDFIEEIFHRLPFLDTKSINLCLKFFAFSIEHFPISITPMILESLQKLAGLQSETIDIENAIESQRCIFNLLSRNSNVEQFYHTNGLADGITQRIQQTNIGTFNEQMKLFDMKILALLTKENIPTRERVRETFHGLAYLFEIINQIILSNDSGVNLSENEIEYLIEILQTLKNLTNDLSHSYDGHFIRLVSILRELILSSRSIQQIQLKTHIVDLLIDIPSIYYGHLLSPMISEEKNIDAIDRNVNCSNEKLSLSLLELLILMCQSNRSIRRYCRENLFSIIDEDNHSLGEKLIDLMNNQSHGKFQLFSTKFLFILCRENVNQLMEYTGLKNVNEIIEHLEIFKRNESLDDQEKYSSDSDQFDMENDQHVD